MTNLIKMARAVPADSSLPGISVTLYAPQNVVPDALYIHAKAILLSDTAENLKSGFV